MKQGPGGIRGPSRATPGSTVEIEVGGGYGSIDLGVAGNGKIDTLPVGPTKKVLVTIPPVPAGTVIVIRAGRGIHAQGVLIEIVETLTP